MRSCSGRRVVDQREGVSTWAGCRVHMGVVALRSKAAMCSIDLGRCRNRGRTVESSRAIWFGPALGCGAWVAWLGGGGRRGSGGGGEAAWGARVDRLEGRFAA